MVVHGFMAQRAVLVAHEVCSGEADREDVRVLIRAEVVRVERSQSRL